MQEGLDAVAALLPRGREHAAQRGEILRSLLGPEPAGDLHAQLHHPQVLLRLVVGEGDTGIADEAQHVLLAVNVQVKNAKLAHRAERIVRKVCGCDLTQGRAALAEADQNVRLAILMLKQGLGRNDAAELLAICGDNLRLALEKTHD